MKYFTWSGKLKLIINHDEKRDKLIKKHPSLDLEKNNKRYPTKITVTYSNSQNKFLITFKIGDEILKGEFKKWAGPWKYGTTLLELSEIKFNILPSKVKLYIRGDKKGELFKFFRYDYETIIPKKGEGTSKKRKKITKHTIAKQYSKCIKKVGPSMWQRYKYTGKPITKKTSVKNKWKLIQASNKRFIKSHKKEMDAYDKRWKRTYKKCNKQQEKQLKLLKRQTK